MKNTKNKETKESVNEVNDFSDDLNEINTDKRNRELDQDILRSGEEIAGITLRRLSAGDLAMLIECGVGLAMGRMNNIAFDVGAILYCQSIDKAKARTIKPSEFRSDVYDFLDKYEPDVFQEATPRVLELIDRVNKSKTAVSGTAAGGGESPDPKAGGRAG
jgi:hypothetical protein